MKDFLLFTSVAMFITVILVVLPWLLDDALNKQQPQLPVKVCALQEDSVLFDCDTGRTLDFYKPDPNKPGWWRAR